MRTLNLPKSKILAKASKNWLEKGKKVKSARATPRWPRSRKSLLFMRRWNLEIEFFHHYRSDLFPNSKVPFSRLFFLLDQVAKMWNECIFEYLAFSVNSIKGVNIVKKFFRIFFIQDPFNPRRAW